MEEAVFKFRGLDFTLLGKNTGAAAKAHWQPFPFPIPPAKGKGTQKGKPERKGQWTQDTDEEGKKQQDKAPGLNSEAWFS